VPPGTILIPIKVSYSMLKHEIPYFVSYIPKEGVEGKDFSIMFFGPDTKAKAALIPAIISADVYSAKGLWSSFETPGEFYVGIVHNKGAPAIKLITKYNVSSERSRSRPIISFKCDPEKGSDGFTGKYELRETCHVKWNIFDSKQLSIRNEDHGTRTENKAHSFVWDRLTDDGSKAKEGDYIMQIVASPKSNSKAPTDYSGLPIEVTK